MSAKKYNVVCVTKRSTDDGGWADFHLDIQGEAEVKDVVNFEKFGVRVLKETVVSFDGQDWEICHVRSGLDGSCVVIGIRRTTEEPFDMWELYTDTPVGDKTPEWIREEAKRCIAQKATMYNR